MIVQTDPRRPGVVLVGPPGAGKSTIGRKLARELGVDLYDTDAGIEEEAGRSIPEIFAAEGEPEFRRMEERVVRRAILEHKGVVSLGGGAVLSAATRELLRGRTVVYLEISVAEGLRRTGASTNRPLLAGDDPGAKYRALMRERRPLYREVASIRVRTDGRSPGRVVRNILGKLGVEPVEREPAPAAPPDDENAVRRSRSRRRRRRGRGGKPSNEAATAADSAQGPRATRQDSDSTPTSAAPEANSTGTDDTAPKRRSRRSRRGGRRRRSTAEPAAAAEGTSAEPLSPPRNSSGGNDASKPRAATATSATPQTTTATFATPQTATATSAAPRTAGANEGRPTGSDDGPAGATRTANRTRRSARRATGAPGSARKTEAAHSDSTPSTGAGTEGSPTGPADPASTARTDRRAGRRRGARRASGAPGAVRESDTTASSTPSAAVPPAPDSAAITVPGAETGRHAGGWNSLGAEARTETPEQTPPSAADATQNSANARQSRVHTSRAESEQQV
ncbi:hypothetical protein GCM10027089_16180 [Nocardia thraciensis]